MTFCIKENEDDCNSELFGDARLSGTCEMLCKVPGAGFSMCVCQLPFFLVLM